MNNLKKILAAATFAFSAAAYAQTTDTASQTVDGTVNETISLSVAGGNAITLNPATASTATTATLTVNSTTAYTVHAKADTDTNKGAHEDKLFEYDTDLSQYVSGGNFVNAVPTIAGASSVSGGAVGTGASGPIDTTGVLIFTGDQAELDGKIDATLTQETPYGTTKLGTGKVYRMVITYTATATGV